MPTNRKLINKSQNSHIMEYGAAIYNMYMSQLLETCCRVLGIGTRLPLVKEHVQKTGCRQRVNSWQREENPGERNEHSVRTPGFGVCSQTGTHLPQSHDAYLYSVQPTQVYLAALPTVASSKVPDSCVPRPCSFSRSKTPVHMCPGKSVLEKGCHPSLGQKYFKDDTRWQSKWRSTGSFPCLQTLGVGSQLSITSNIHARVSVQCKFMHQVQQSASMVFPSPVPSFSITEHL